MGSHGLRDLLVCWSSSTANDDKNTQRFLREDTVTMLNDRSSVSWSGKIVDGGVIRYHPETIRSAARRSGDSLQDLEQKYCLRGASRDVRVDSFCFATRRYTPDFEPQDAPPPRRMLRGFPAFFQRILIQDGCPSSTRFGNGKGHDRWHGDSWCVHQQSQIHRYCPATEKGHDGGRRVRLGEEFASGRHSGDGGQLANAAVSRRRPASPW